MVCLRRGFNLVCVCMVDVDLVCCLGYLLFVRRFWSVGGFLDMLLVVVF